MQVKDMILEDAINIATAEIKKNLVLTSALVLSVGINIILITILILK